MRTLVAILGLGLLSFSLPGCGSSSPGDGGTTTGAAVTTGGATTGSTTGGTTTTGTTGQATSGGTTTSGTTTGGTAGSPGSPCTSNSQCLSDICGINGTGLCCASACSTSDATCGATGCDPTGACTYTGAGIACGVGSCRAGVLTHSYCDGAGTCAPYTPTPCPGDFACNSAGTACITTCTVPSDCVTGFYCAAPNCVPQQARGTCAANDVCLSGFCGATGTGNCCAAQCMATADMACDATNCDATSGACIYPAGSACGAPATCVGSTLTAAACDATGACNSSTTTCAKNLGCNDAGTACNTSCTVLSDCATGFYCFNSACRAQEMTGACGTNDACVSGVCGAGSGSGHCCTAACPNNTPPCGSKDCDFFSGACTFPGNAVSCGPASSCTGNTQTDATLCDGKGGCPAPGTTDCTPYVCGATTGACLTSCTDSTSCVSGDFCDTSFAPSKCCTLSAGGTINVDSSTGTDATCCGTGSNNPCFTITQAMKMINAAQVQNVTINATVNGGGGSWDPNFFCSEASPIQLGWGAELYAPGVYFSDACSFLNNSVFEIGGYNDSAYPTASMVGASGNQIGVGMDQYGNQTYDNATIVVDNGRTLYLANASVNNNYAVNEFFGGSGDAITVAAGAILWLGQDQSASNTGTVNIGNNLGYADGWTGIDCQSDYSSSGCTVNDAQLSGTSSVVIEGQDNVDIDAEDFASISLTSVPVIGTATNGTGFNQCNSKPDSTQNFGNGEAIWLNGAVTMTFKNGTVQCITGAGFRLNTSGNGNGSPSLTLDSTTIQNTDRAIYASAGKATVTNTTINYNFNGVQQDTDGTNNGTIDLTGGGNTVVCSSNQESSQGSSNEGIDVYNTSTANLGADNVAWDTTAPDYFSCDSASGTATCSCNITTCSNTAPFDDMDAVEDSTNLGGITTTNNTQSSAACN
jgi:hypothetical protein